jgi:hypothetical protein
MSRARPRMVSPGLDGHARERIAGDGGKSGIRRKWRKADRRAIGVDRAHELPRPGSWRRSGRTPPPPRWTPPAPAPARSRAQHGEARGGRGPSAPAAERIRACRPEAGLRVVIAGSIPPSGPPRACAGSAEVGSLSSDESARKGLNSESSAAATGWPMSTASSSAAAGAPLPRGRGCTPGAVVERLAGQASRAARRSRSLRAARFAGAPEPAG